MVKTAPTWEACRSIGSGTVGTSADSIIIVPPSGVTVIVESLKVFPSCLSISSMEFLFRSLTETKLMLGSPL